LSSVNIAGDTSGLITLQAPAVSGSTVLTLPTTTGTLVVNSGAQTIEFADGSASAPSITNSGNTNTGIFFPAADTIAFAEGGVEVMRIDSAGNVGIGIASPASALFVSANTATGGVPEINLENSQNFEAANYLNYKTELIFRGDKQNRYSGAGAILGPLASIKTIYSNPTLTADSQQGAGALTFNTRAETATTSSDTLTERMRITAAGEVLVGITSAVSGGANLQVSDGITFPATAVASANANTLDDYEEGTFTPTIIGTTTAGTGTYSANSQIGRYTKIGNRVYFNIYLVWTAHTGTGNMSVAGLPFTSIATAGTFNALSTWYQNITMTALNLLTAYVNVNATIVSLSQTPVGGGAATAVAMDTAGSLLLTGHYEVA
jgi:hypothetical protein